MLCAFVLFALCEDLGEMEKHQIARKTKNGLWSE